jgi:hypothetical protein
MKKYSSDTVGKNIPGIGGICSRPGWQKHFKCKREHCCCSKNKECGKTILITIMNEFPENEKGYIKYYRQTNKIVHISVNKRNKDSIHFKHFIENKKNAKKQE